MARFWRDLAWPDFVGLDPETIVAVLPSKAAGVAALVAEVIRFPLSALVDHPPI